MKKIVWSAVAVVVAVVVAYNGYLLVKMFSPKGSPTPKTARVSGTTSTVAVSNTPINVAPTKTPEPTLVPVKSLTRKPLPCYFLVSEVACHLHYSKSGMKYIVEPEDTEGVPIASYANILATLLDLDNAQFSSIIRKAETFDLLFSASGEIFYALSYPSLASDLLAKEGLGADNLSGLITMEGGKAYFGPLTGERSARLRHNEPFPEGRGSYADEITDLADSELFLRMTKGHKDFTKFALFGDILKLGTVLQIYCKNGLTSMAIKWEGGPEWIGQLAIDSRIAITPFIPETSPLAMVVALPRESERNLVSKAIWSVLMPNESEKKEQEFKENLGLLPMELARNIRSRFFFFYPDPESEMTPEDAVFGFDLSHKSTVESLLESFRAGEVFSDTEVMTMLYNGRKISFPAGEAKPGFSISMINDVLLMSPKNEYIRSCIDATMTEARGLFAGMENEKALKFSEGASVLLRIAPKCWPEVFPFLPEGHCGRTNWFSFKFSRRWLVIDTTLGPESYLEQMFETLIAK